MRTTFYIVAALVAFGAATTTASAQTPGQWVFTPARCLDLVEDRRDRLESRRDERVDYSRRDVREDIRDRRESRRDEDVVMCPSSAWVWHGATYRAQWHPARPAAVRVYYDAAHRHYFHRAYNTKIVIKF